VRPPRGANQIVFDTLICEALADFALHGVLPDELVQISRDFDVVFVWSLAYGNVRNPFNARFVRFPLIIAFPRTVADVVFWVNFVREHGFSVSIRSGNNNYEGFSTANEIVIDLTFLTLDSTVSPGTKEQFRLDKKAGVVHVSPGMRLGVLYTELAKLGVTVAGGQCSPVCVGGIVGSGGYGYSTREFGYVCDQLEEVEYVLADGSVVVANATNAYADLYRATKGAGAAGLGAMTRLTLRVVPSVKMLFHTVIFDLADAAIVLEKWQNLVATAPDALSSIATFGGNSTAIPTGVLFVNGTFRIENGKVKAAKKELEQVLRTQWLDLLPPPLNETPIDMKC
jgi:FAD/FMN-containing dehydrogenase